ncbi:MAG: cysteine desulfurase family protein [Candidatus Saccharimonadales bacterium]
MDYAAATPVAKEVLTAMQPFWSEQFYNPSANYLAAKNVKKVLDEARASLAHWLGARANEIIFTAGGSEADNLAITGVMSQYPNANLVISGLEHDAILKTATEFNCSVTLITGEGRVDINDLLAKIDDQTVLVSVMLANNEIGTLQPLRDISHKLGEIKSRRRQNGNSLPLYLHTDASQAANYMDLHVSRLGVDLMSLNGGKIYGPKQSGALYVSSKVKLVPLIRGGGQERGLRSGTENVAADIGLARALELVQSDRHVEAARLQELQQLAYRLIGEKLPGAYINGSTKQRLPNNLHIILPGQDNERLLVELDECGIMAAAGSACSADSAEPSHVLRAIGLSDAEARSSLRLTMGRQTTEVDIIRVISVLVELAG